MSVEEKSQACDATLKLLISEATGAHYRQMISVEFAAHCKIDLKHLVRECEMQEDEESDQVWITQGREGKISHSHIIILFLSYSYSSGSYSRCPRYSDR